MSIKVVHSYSHWLPVTMNWLDNQIRFLPEGVSSCIFCDHRVNDGAFHQPCIHVLEKDGAFRLWKNKILRKTGWGKYNAELTRFCRNQNASLLHSHFGHTGWENLGEARKSRLPHMVTFYGADVQYLPQNKPVWKKRYQQLFQEADLFLCEGPFMRNSLLKLGCPPEKALVHHLGVDTENISFQPNAIWDKPRILIASSFREKKGIPYALQAILDSGIMDFEVTIIGGAGNDRNGKEEEKKILSIAQKKQFKNKIKFLGYQPYERLQTEMSRHHFFIAASVTAKDGDSEGGAPLGIIEACAAGLLVFSTRHCDIPNVVVHNETGFLSPEKNPQKMADNLLYAIENPEKVEILKRNGRKRVEALFSAKLQGQQLTHIYHNLLSKDSHGA